MKSEARKPQNALISEANFLNPSNSLGVPSSPSATIPKGPRNARGSKGSQGADGRQKNQEWPLEISKGGCTVRVFRSVSKAGYESFTIAYYEFGKRQRAVLSEESAARAQAKLIHKRLVDGQVEAAGMRLQDIVAYENAKRFLAPTGVSLETACREYAQAHELLRGTSLLTVVREFVERREQVVAEKTVQEVVNEYLAAKESGRATRMGGKGVKVSEKYLYQLERRLRKLEAAVTGPIAEVDADDINEFILGLKDRHGKALRGRTRNNYAESVGVLWQFARKQRYVRRDSMIVDELEEWAEEDFDIEIFTPEEMAKVLACAPAIIMPVLLLGGFAGLRTAEIARLDWSEVNFEGGHVEVKARKAKTRSRRLVPISENLAALLEPYRKESGPVWSLSLPYLFELVAGAAAKAKLKWKHNGLRHSFISYRVAQVQNVDKVALEAGNSPDIIFEHYRELVTAKGAKAWFGITPEAVEEARKKAMADSEASKVKEGGERAAAVMVA